MNLCKKEPSYSNLNTYKTKMYDGKKASIHFYNKDSTSKVLFTITLYDNKYKEKKDSLRKYLFGKVDLIDFSDLKDVFKSTPDEKLKKVVNAFNKYAGDYDINTPKKIAHFFGQIGAETGGLKNLTESSNYTQQNIKDNFLKKKYCDLFEGYNSPDNTKCPLPECDPKFKNDIDLSSLSIKNKYVNSSSLFDYVYGCRMGNGAPSTKEGSTFKGKGFIHLTGKEMYKQISDEWNIKYPKDKKEFDGKDLELLTTNVEVAMKASMIFWKIKKLNDKADIGMDDDDIDKVGVKVNGTNPPNGQNKRRELSKAIYDKLK